MMTDQIWERDKDDPKGFYLSNERMESRLMKTGNIPRKQF